MQTMNIDYNHIFRQIADSLHHYYGLHVTVKIAYGADLFPKYNAVTTDGNITYIIWFNPKVETILSLYNRAMSDGEDIGEAVNRYMLFNAFLELDDYISAERQLNVFRQELDRLSLTHRTSETQKEAEGQILLQIYYILLHEAFHIIFKHSTESKAMAMATTHELLCDMKDELTDQLSLISNEELLSHPKTKEHLSALIPTSLPQEEREEMEAQLRKEMESHPYSTEYIDLLLHGEDEVLVEEMTCDRQAWLNLVSMIQDDGTTPEDLLELHQWIFVVFCAMDFNHNLQAQYRPSLHVKYEYDGRRVVFRHKAFKTLLRQYHPDTYRLVTTQYLDLNKGLEAIFSTSTLGIIKYQEDFAHLYQIYQEKTNLPDLHRFQQLEKEMAEAADKL